MNLLPVHDKLAEASFFLRHLTQEQGKTTLQRPEDAFRFYLSVFLNAAYSAREYLERSAKDKLKVDAAKKQESGNQAKAKYDKWEDEWIRNLSAADKIVWNLMTTNRRREVHEIRVETIKEAKAVPADDFSTRNSYYYNFSNASSFFPAIAVGGSEGVDPMSEEKRKLGLPPWCNAWTYADRHYITVDGEQVGVADVCTQYYVLLQKLIADFEQSNWDRGFSPSV